MTEERSYDSLIENRIFMGGAKDVQAMVKNEGVKVIVDLREESEGCAYHSESVQWVKIALNDEAEEEQAATLKKAIEAVTTAYHSGVKVGFHCGGGKGRTGAVAIGTLLELGMSNSIEDAEEKAKLSRPILNIKPKQREALERLYE